MTGQRTNKPTPILDSFASVAKVLKPISSSLGLYNSMIKFGHIDNGGQKKYSYQIKIRKCFLKMK